MDNQNDLKLLQSQAQKIPILVAKYKKGIRAQEHLVSFKEPVIFFIRKNNTVEFYENATKGKFKFTDHTDEEREIELNPKFQLTFAYGKSTFRGYICHEDSPTPLPSNQLITAEFFNMIIDKTLFDVRNWRAEEMKAKGELIWKALIGIAIIAGIYVVYKLSFHPETGLLATNISNISNITQNITMFT